MGDKDTTGETKSKSILKKSILKSRPPEDVSENVPPDGAGSAAPLDATGLGEGTKSVQSDNKNTQSEGESSKPVKKSILKTNPPTDVGQSGEGTTTEEPVKKKSILKMAPRQEDPQVNEDHHGDAVQVVPPEGKEDSRDVSKQDFNQGVSTAQKVEKKRPKKTRREKSNVSKTSRESTFNEDLAKAHERTYSHWVAAKDERKVQEQSRLTEKLRLQAELIQAQDELFEKRKRQAEVAEQRKRQLEKEAKQAKQEELLKICQESIDRDRKRREERLERERKRQLSAIEKTSSPGLSLDSSSPLDRQSILRKSAGLLLGMSRPMTTNQEEPEEDQESLELTDEQLSALPWHHAQLYRLYGSAGADNFIHPKIEQKPKKPVPQKMRRQGGRAGADALWSTLREDSVRKLLQVDRHIPTELKQAYGAFVRQLLRKKIKPVKRNFFATEDVPEMERLLDNSTLLNIAEYRHKVGMMHHSAVGNEDRGNVIMHNNPPPDFNNYEGHEGINRYLPSWIHDTWELESLPEYKKWLHKIGSTEGDTQSYLDDVPSEAPLPLPEIPEVDETELVDHMTKSLMLSDDKRLHMTDNTNTNNNVENQWDFMLARQNPKPSLKKPKYQFLTEKDATVPGQFSTRYSEMRENRDIPKPASPSHLQGTRSAMAVVGGSGSALSSRRDSCLDSMLSQDRRSLRHSAPSGGYQQEFCRRYTDSWEPLSMRALVEYKTHMKTLGEGDFKYGTPSLWSHKSVGVGLL